MLIQSKGCDVRLFVCLSVCAIGQIVQGDGVTILRVFYQLGYLVLFSLNWPVCAIDRDPEPHGLETSGQRGYC